MDKSLEVPHEVVHGGEIRAAILRAATQRRWVATEIRPGVIRCVLTQRKHEIQVDVVYTQDTFSVHYADSKNMKYSPRTNWIHRKYNRWASDLKREILIQLNPQSF